MTSGQRIASWIALPPTPAAPSSVSSLDKPRFRDSWTCEGVKSKPRCAVRRNPLRDCSGYRLGRHREPVPNRDSSLLQLSNHTCGATAANGRSRPLLGRMGRNQRSASKTDLVAAPALGIELDAVVEAVEQHFALPPVLAQRLGQIWTVWGAYLPSLVLQPNAIGANRQTSRQTWPEGLKIGFGKTSGGSLQAP